MSDKTKEYIKSATLTFCAGFIMAVLASWDSFTLESIKSGAVFGILFTAFRTALKAVLELAVVTFKGE